MIKSPRIIYAVLVISIILLGLISRRIPLIPLSVGDVLWAMMIFFIVRFLFIHSSIRLIALVSLVLCYLVEFSQIYQEDWINTLRHTTFGRLVLGQGFLWSDMVAYTLGVVLGLSIESFLVRHILKE